MMLHRLPLLILSVASSWLKLANWCSGSAEAENPSLATAEELTTLLNSLNVATETTVTADGAVSRLPSLHNATNDSSSRHAMPRSSPPGQRTTMAEPAGSTPIPDGTEGRHQAVPSGISARLRSTAGPQASPTTTNEEPASNTGLLPAEPIGSTGSSRRSSWNAMSSRTSTTTTSRMSRTPQEATRAQAVSTTTTTTMSPVIYRGMPGSTNSNIIVRTPASSGGLASSTAHISQNDDAFHNGNAPSNGHIDSNRSVPSNGNTTSHLSVSHTVANGGSTSNIQGGVSSEAAYRPTSSSVAPTSGSNGNTAGDAVPSTPSSSGQMTVAAFIRKRQDALQRLYARLVEISVQAAEALDLLAEEQERLNELRD